MSIKRSCIDCSLFLFPCPKNTPKKPNPNTIGWGYCKKFNEKYIEDAKGCRHFIERGS